MRAAAEVLAPRADEVVDDVMRLYGETRPELMREFDAGAVAAVERDARHHAFRSRHERGFHPGPGRDGPTRRPIPGAKVLAQCEIDETQRRLVHGQHPRFGRVLDQRLARAHLASTSA